MDATSTTSALYNHALNPEIWGPSYWDVLHTMAVTYPENPTPTRKKQYYDWIMSFPLVIPHDEIAKKFNEMLILYSVEPYLDSRDRLARWVHFIHNKINEKQGKSQITFTQWRDRFEQKYRPNQFYSFYSPKIPTRIAFTVFLAVALLVYAKRN